MGERPDVLQVVGAAEHNLREVDVAFPAGVTAVAGVSGSGKSSLVFDTVYHEARRRFLETFSLGSPALRMRPARVRAIDGLRPAVAVAQNVVNRNPNSTLATAVGVHPFLRVLYARFAERRCHRCGEVATTTSLDGQLAVLRELAATGPVDVIAPLVRGVPGSHQRLLAHLVERFGATAVEVDGAPAGTGQLDPDQPHEIAVLIGTTTPDAAVPALRRLLESVTALGTVQVTLRSNGMARTLSRAPLCTGCGVRLPVARPQDFRDAGGDPDSTDSTDGLTSAYRLAGRTMPELLRLDVHAAAAALADADLPARAHTAIEQVQRRLAALAALDLGYLTLDRPSPTLSRGEAQRVRLAVILANGVEDLLHVVDEPTIGLDAGQVGRLVGELGRLRGPVVLVEHDRNAVAAADHVIELGPDAGSGGGRVVYEGTPAGLWQADTASGRWFSGRTATDAATPATPATRAKRRVDQRTRWLTVRRAARHNLRGFDCAFPVGALTVVTGPSGAGKTTLVRDVLVGSLRAGEPAGCDAVHGPSLAPIFVDQSPIGRNPRSNAATYTGLAERIRARFAAATALPASAFSFNRTGGACAECAGMGSVEVKLRYLPSEWMTCERCQGRRFGADALAAKAHLADGNAYLITEVYASTVREAAGLLADDARAARILTSLLDVGLGYLPLGQSSPTLSGGEAQRVKLARQLATARPGQLVFLDEPTTGLHPANLSQLVAVLHSLVDRGCTVVVVEHNPDVVAAADWVVRLGDGGGPDGGRLAGAGPPDQVATAGAPAEPRRTPRTRPRGGTAIEVSGATANNLRGVSVSLAKRELTAVVGVSGSGKSSLVRDVLEAEAMRRLLESLSMYERQSVRDGPDARAGSVTGLGPTVAIGPQRRLENPRSTVGTATELSLHLAVLLAYAGTTGQRGQRGQGEASDGEPLTPADFSPRTYHAACLRCQGIGTVPVPRVERLIQRPDLPICAGALYSPGFFPQSYLAKPANGGYWMLRALAEQHGFDPFHTPWERMSEAAREAFLFGEQEVQLAPEARRMASRTVTWRGMFLIFAGWDVGGLYTEHASCPECDGQRLRPRYLDVTVAGLNRHALHHRPVAEVGRSLTGVEVPAGAPSWAGRSLSVVCRRLAFLDRVGLGYLHLDRLSSTLSAGEVQRVKLASLLGAELTGMTVLLDEPSRGLHPREVDAVGDALAELRAAGNTVVFVDHDPRLVRRAGRLVVLGPGAGRDGGTIVAAGPAGEVRLDPAAGPLLAPAAVAPGRARREPAGWLVVRKPTEHNLTGQDVRLPLGVLAGVCGASGSGKSTLAIDILARALAPAKLTTSVAHEAVNPGAHDGIDGAPARTVHADQNRAGIHSPGAFLGVQPVLRRRYAASGDAAVLGLDARDLVPRCDACRGRGSVREDMSFLPSVEHPCDACEATGYRAEVRELAVRGLSLPRLDALTLVDVLERWDDQDAVAGPLRAAVELGLGYLTLGQRSRTLSGGERQRLKLARELAKPAARSTLYILDEPTVGLHASDIDRLAGALDGLVRRGHSVLVVDHDPVLLGRCDHLVELGPGGGPDGGRVVASGTPERLAAGGTATAPYLREVLA